MNDAADRSSSGRDLGRRPLQASPPDPVAPRHNGAARAPRRGSIRTAGIAAILVFLVLVGRFWHPVYGFTAFLQLDSSNDEVKIAAFKQFPV
jgi:hypothetical protein